MSTRTYHVPRHIGLAGMPQIAAMVRCPAHRVNTQTYRMVWCPAHCGKEE